MQQLMNGTTKDIKALKLGINNIFHDLNFQPSTSHDTNSEIENLIQVILSNPQKSIKVYDFIGLFKDFSLAEYGYIPEDTSKVAESIFKFWRLK
ncbi:hypothetical protein BH09PAT1_BH09PAT1_3190 [soil metagenome]